MTSVIASRDCTLTSHRLLKVAFQNSTLPQSKYYFIFIVHRMSNEVKRYSELTVKFWKRASGNSVVAVARRAYHFSPVQSGPVSQWVASRATGGCENGAACVFRIFGVVRMRSPSSPPSLALPAPSSRCRRHRRNTYSYEDPHVTTGTRCRGTSRFTVFSQRRTVSTVSGPSCKASIGGIHG